MNLLTEPFAIRALIAAAAVGITAPVIGAFLVQRRLSLIGDGVGHLAFSGVAIGVVAGVSPVWGALALSLLGVVVLERLRVRGRLAGDLSLALVFYAGIALGVVVLSSINRLDSSVIGVLFGSIFTTTPGEVALIVILCVGIVGATALVYHHLLAVALDEDTARASGLPVDRLNLLLVGLTALLVAAGMRAVGLLLVAAMLVIPVAAGSRISHSFRGSMFSAAAGGGIAAIAGVLIALIQGTVAPGGTIVLTSIVLFGVATLIGRPAARRHQPGGSG